jgi:hypothetical protein
MVYVIIIGEPDTLYYCLCTFLWLGNSSNPTFIIPPVTENKSEEDLKRENSKTIYIHDSFNLNCIPSFDFHEIIEQQSNDKDLI